MVKTKHSRLFEEAWFGHAKEWFSAFRPPTMIYGAERGRTKIPFSVVS